MPEDRKAFREAHARNARAGAREMPVDAAKTPSDTPGPFGGVETRGIVENALERASGALNEDVVLSGRLTSVLARTALVRQLLIVTARQREYMAGDSPFPKDEVAALRVLADLASADPPYTPEERASVYAEFELNSAWDWDV